MKQGTVVTWRRRTSICCESCRAPVENWVPGVDRSQVPGGVEPVAIVAPGGRWVGIFEGNGT